VLEFAPPTPPPTIGGGGGGDGNGDSGEFLRLLSSTEKLEVLLDWEARSRIYAMSETMGIGERQGALLEVLNAMQQHQASARAEDSSKHLLIGLYDTSRLLAISSADISVRNGLTVKHLAVHPQDVNNEDSTTALRLLHGLHVLAETIDVPLDLVPLRESGGTLIGAAWSAEEDSM
jgi:hypothetical protein